MTRKDFVLIAETVRFLTVSPATRALIAADFGNALRGTNPNFDKERFIDAATKPTRVG